MLKRMQLSATNRPIEVIKYWRDSDQLELSPPYQRGDVWGRLRRQNLIRSILLGVPIPSLVVNDRMAAEWAGDDRTAVIDGKQRMTTILMFLDGVLQVPADWFGIKGGYVTYTDLPPARRRGFSMMPLPFAEGTLRTIDHEIEVFELINFGGVPLGETDPLT